MICFLFRPRRHVAGKVEVARLYSGRVRLDGWASPKTFSLGVKDKRSADQKLREIVQELEREAAGLAVPRLAREGAQRPLLGHLGAFLRDIEARGRAKNTITHYRKNLTKLCDRCGWVFLRDVTARSFCEWRASSDLSPKFVNDLLGFMRTFLGWLRREGLLLADPLEHVEKVSNSRVGGYRRALSAGDVQKFLAAAPPKRAAVYLIILYTGLRRAEMNRLKWGDFDLDGTAPRVFVPATVTENGKAVRVTKNGRAAVIELRPEAVAAVRSLMPDLPQPFEWAFRCRVPSAEKVRQDLAAAGIPFKDERGRRVDLHALRTTFGTMLSVSGIAPRVAMELMRHSDIRLTMQVYTDAGQLPLASEVAKLPSFRVPVLAQDDTQIRTLSAVAQGVAESRAVAPSQKLAIPQNAANVTFRCKKPRLVGASRGV